MPWVPHSWLYHIISCVSHLQWGEVGKACINGKETYICDGVDSPIMIRDSGFVRPCFGMREAERLGCYARVAC
jgi:hypothetical protein